MIFVDETFVEETVVAIRVVAVIVVALRFVPVAFVKFIPVIVLELLRSCEVEATPVAVNVPIWRLPVPVAFAKVSPDVAFTISAESVPVAIRLDSVKLVARRFVTVRFVPVAFVKVTPARVDTPETVSDPPRIYPLAVRFVEETFVPLAFVNVSPVIVDVPMVNSFVELLKVNDESPPSVEEER